METQNQETQAEKKATKKSSTKSDKDALNRILPSAIEIEKAVLGIMLLEKDAVDTVSGIISPDCFYLESHKKICRAIFLMSQRSSHIDLISVAQELKELGDLESIGGPYTLSVCQNGVTSSAGLEQHCHIILEKFMSREMIRICDQISNEAYSDGADVLGLLDRAEQRLLAIGDASIKGDMTHIGDVLVKAMERIDGFRKNETTITGIPSGFPKLDKATRGWQPGDLVILAARPSIGKTALALHLLDSAADFIQPDESAAVWSLEMDAVSLVLRMLSKKSEMLLHRIQTGRLDDDQMKMLYREGVQKLANQNIYFDDSPGLTLYGLRSKARRLKKKKKLRIIIVDYVQLMSSGEDTRIREQEIAKISRGLKNLARELQVPIIALSQLSRDIEKRTGKKKSPQLSDLRESGAIEQDADLVIFLWGPDEEEIEADRSLENIRWGKIAKHRNGVLVNLTFEFANGIQKFKEIDDIPDRKPSKDAPKELGNGKWKPVQKEAF